MSDECSHVWVTMGKAQHSTCRKCGALKTGSSLSPNDPIMADKQHPGPVKVTLPDGTIEE